eukprot:TRINITY_DN7976_c0_g1_i1.p1 TRINITY_DN7976_c0_g1~~TRINITY_DN7976_c0_g1_i1.p1  ORF type:complete len:413 (-),score=48.58 TRINITY_DN7976_c0_g1_i1:126-1364(-)
MTFAEILEQIPWFRVTVGCNTFIFLLELYLDILQARKMRQYGHSKNWLNFARVESTVGFLCELIVLMKGLLVTAWSISSSLMSDCGLREYRILQGVAYIFVVSFYSSLVRAPFEIFRVVFIETHVQTRWGTLLRMAADQIGMFVVSFVVGVPALGVALSLLYWKFQYQWLLLVVFVASVAVLFSDVYAVIIAPMFNTYSRLPDGELRSEIMQLAYQLEYPLRDVYTVDGSLRGAHSNAFLMGFWNHSVVLYDTLVTQLSTQQILAIIGHEIGHHKFGHTWKHLTIQMAFLGNFIFLFSRVVDLPGFYSNFGFEVVDPSIGLVLFSYLYSTFANFFTFLTNVFRRRFEYEADAYATAAGLDIKGALVTMCSHSSHVLPDPLYSLYHFSHPPLSERIAWLNHYQYPSMLLKKRL